MQPITITIDEDGNQVFLKGHGADVFLPLGQVKTQRASFIEPDSSVLRCLFHLVRRHCTDTSRMAAFTRIWPCLWRVHIVNGPVLEGRWRNRLEAIEAEISFLNDKFFLGENQ